MPIYEFYCGKCHVIFNFYSKTINTRKVPECPGCGRMSLERRMSVFASPRNRGEDEDPPIPHVDEARMEKAFEVIAREAENLDENDPRQAADLMRRLTHMTGMDLGPGMEEALSRMEAGEDIEKIEADMGDLLEGDDLFDFRQKMKKASARQGPPRRDDKLYDL